jgi:hypothetical protein
MDHITTSAMNIVREYVVMEAGVQYFKEKGM